MWRIPAVVFAIVVVTVTFVGDGALESFLAVYLSQALASGVLRTGVGIGSFHLASLAGRSAPGRSGQAVALTTAAGYSAFIVSPVLVGSLADVTGLRSALSLLVLTTLTVAALGLRWPRS